MPSWAWVVTYITIGVYVPVEEFQCPHGLELLPYQMFSVGLEANVSMPSRAWVVTVWPGEACGYAFTFQCPHGLELLLEVSAIMVISLVCFNALTGLSCYYFGSSFSAVCFNVSMPSRAWVVTAILIHLRTGSKCFNALTGLSCYRKNVQYFKFFMILFMHPCYLYVYISIPSNFFQPII